MSLLAMTYDDDELDCFESVSWQLQKGPSIPIAPACSGRAAEARYRRNGALTDKKLREYIPIMVVNNLSVLLLVSVDGLVLGNLVGKNALAAVNIFYPATTLIGVASVLVGCGTGTSLAVAVGKGDHDALMRLKSAVKRVMVIAAIVMSVVQVPLVAGIISSYGLDDNMTQMTWQYAMGIMIATPFGLISTVGTYQFQATGNMRWLMRLSIMKGLANLFLDILFVGPLGMGVMCTYGFVNHVLLHGSKGRGVKPSCAV